MIRKEEEVTANELKNIRRKTLISLKNKEDKKGERGR